MRDAARDQLRQQPSVYRYNLCNFVELSAWIRNNFLFCNANHFFCSFHNDGVMRVMKCEDGSGLVVDVVSVFRSDHFCIFN